MRIGLPQIGISLVDPKPNQEDALHQMAAQESGVIAIEPERIVSAIDARGDYMRGWRDAVDALTTKLLEQKAPAPAALEAAEQAYTWGPDATKYLNARCPVPASRSPFLIPGLI